MATFALIFPIHELSLLEMKNVPLLTTVSFNFALVNFISKPSSQMAPVASMSFTIFPFKSNFALLILKIPLLTLRGSSTFLFPKVMGPFRSTLNKSS